MRAFSVLEPTAEETPVVVEIPHAGLFVDGPAIGNIAAPARALGRDADLYVDELYEGAPETGATCVVAHVSRYLVDLNRAETDIDAESVEGAPAGARATRGVVWRLSSDGARVLVAPLSRLELERRLDTYHRPYHRAVASALEKKRARFGFAILLAAHSMPSVGRAGAGDPSPARADVVPGTRGKTSAAPSIIDVVEAHARAAKLSVSHDDPYQGGYSTQHYGRPAAGVHAVQVELSRRLYMNEPTLEKAAGFDRMSRWCTDLVAALGKARP